MRCLRAEHLLLSGGQDAREQARLELAAAREIAERLGAAGKLRELATLEQDHALVHRGGAPHPVHPPDTLTRREREVLALVARGYSNRSIAQQLIISEKTAEFHVGNILGKLALATRVEAATYAVTHGLAPHGVT